MSAAPPRPVRQAATERPRRRNPAAAPLPTLIKPMLALLGPLPAPAEDASYAYETKWDGFRALTRWDGSSFTMVTRNQIDLLQRFPVLAGLRKALRQPVILDGEIVALDARGRDSFSAMQQRGHSAAPVRIVYHLFDVMHLGGRSVMPLPYLERRELLEGLGLRTEHWDVPPHQVGGGVGALARSLAHGSEGIIAKRCASPYRPGVRNDDWIKVKNVKRDEFVAAGYLPSTKLAGIAKLLLGYYEPGPAGRPVLHYAGGVGTGFSLADRVLFKQLIDRYRVAASPFAAKVEKGAVFTGNPFVVEVAYTEWTHGGALRHPVFLGVRPDKDPIQVTDPRVPAVER